MPCHSCSKHGIACAFTPTDSGRKKACDNCAQRKLKCEGAVMPTPAKKAKMERKAKKIRDANAEAPEVKKAEEVKTPRRPAVPPVASGSGSVAQGAAGVAPARGTPDTERVLGARAQPARVPIKKSGRRDSLNAVMDSTEPVWPLTARYSNSELLYALLGEVQGLRRELADVRDELWEAQELRQRALAAYFAMWMGDYEEALATGRMPSDDEAEFSEEGSEFQPEEEEEEEDQEEKEDKKDKEEGEEEE